MKKSIIAPKPEKQDKQEIIVKTQIIPIENDSPILFFGK